MQSWINFFDSKPFGTAVTGLVSFGIAYLMVGTGEEFARRFVGGYGRLLGHVSSCGAINGLVPEPPASIPGTSSLSDSRDKRSNRETNGIDESIFSNEIPP